jgi:hypothetical protein
MPDHNEFRHQLYPSTPIITPVAKTLELLPAVPGEMHALHCRCRIGRVVLVHGTFVGNDPLGFAAMFDAMAEGAGLLSGGLKEMARQIRENSPALATAVMRDMGTYTTGFRQTFQDLVGDDPAIELLEPKWTSQNHHLARAELAVQLLLQLIRRPLPDDQRVLLWGHSHAGNAFALLTNLLANDRTWVPRFFEAVGSHTSTTFAEAAQELAQSPTPHPMAQNLDIVTFGTPVRYGWDTLGCQRLIHVSYHRPVDPEKPLMAPPPFSMTLAGNLLTAQQGDWVQQIGIAGTDVPAPNGRDVQTRLSALLERNLPEPPAERAVSLFPKGFRDTYARWKTGTRCHTNGQNLLVDYELSGQKTVTGLPIEHSLLGHGVATTVAWLPTHLKLVLETLSVNSPAEK